MNISGKTRIFKNNFNGKDVYSTTINSKNLNGEWEKMYISIQLPKDVNVENGTDIDVKKGFISFFKLQNGLQKIKFVIQEMDILNNSVNDGYITISDEEFELPF